MTRLLIYGDGGVGREALTPARLLAPSSGIDEVLVVDDRSTATDLDGTPVVRFDAARAGDLFVVAIADGRLRERIAARCIDAGLRPWSLIAPNVIVGARTDIGEGALIAWNTVIPGFCRIGRHFQCHGYSYIAHDCVIGDFVTFGIHVICNGNVDVGDHAYVGTGAILRHATPGRTLVIGAGAVIGIGAVVTQDVPPGATVTAQAVASTP